MSGPSASRPKNQPCPPVIAIARPAATTRGPGSTPSSTALLKVLGEAATYYGTDAGLASVYFMALIGLSYEIWIAYLHTLALVGAENVDAMTFAPSAAEVLTPTIELLTEMARAADEGHYPAVAGPLSTHAALMDDLIDTWQARDIDVERLKHVKTLIDRRVACLHRVLLDRLGAADRIDWERASRASLDSASVAAKRGASGSARTRRIAANRARSATLWRTEGVSLSR